MDFVETLFGIAPILVPARSSSRSSLCPSSWPESCASSAPTCRVIRASLGLSGAPGQWI